MKRVPEYRRTDVKLKAVLDKDDWLILTNEPTIYKELSGDGTSKEIKHESGLEVARVNKASGQYRETLAINRLRVDR